MRNYSMLLAAVLMVQFSYAQRLTKYAIGKSGCSYYNYCEASFENSYSPDSSLLYTGECASGAQHYGVICVQLTGEAVTSDIKTAEDLLVAYTDYLKTAFNIVKSAGYGKGHHLKDNINTAGILDYWEDKDGNNWKIKAWTNGKIIAFMYVNGSQVPEEKANVFLEGFRFPGM